jgi:hypothetical protein
MACHRVSPIVLTLLTAGALALGGCAGVTGSAVGAFADPSQFALYDCKQLKPVRTFLENRETELRGRMAKAEQAVGGAIIAEAAYRSELLNIQGQRQNADEAWAASRCDSDPSVAAPKPR